MFQKIPQDSSELWIVTYLTAIRAGQSIKYATQAADECLSEFNARSFKKGALTTPFDRSL